MARHTPDKKAEAQRDEQVTYSGCFKGCTDSQGSFKCVFFFFFFFLPLMEIAKYDISQ